ncbi:membrane protein [Mucor ambiguus]|uniref:Membrane protein n=1 Tax=Mucor ambiguus TaxID=91626 RepID=A0A0C9MPX5_9FUNG|nr:membrane protein [Mucor ambiguus]
MSNLHIFQKVANVLVYLLFLSATVYNLVGSTPSEPVVHDGLTYLTPSHWIEYVWTLIHFLLGGFVIYQWFEPAHEAAIHGVGWHFVVSVLLSSAWLTLLQHGHFIIGFVFVLLTASSVSCVFYKLAKDYPTTSWWDKLFIHAPFSLWHGWIVFSAVINLFQAFTGLRENGPSIWIRILAILAIVFLTSTAIGYVEYKKHKGDVTGAVVIGLGLLAIFTNQHDAWIHWPALVGAIITLLYPARPYLFKLVGRSSDSENAPLLG